MIVLSVLLYASENWTVVTKHVNQLEIFQMKCLRFICGFTLSDHKRNDHIRRECFDQPSIDSELRFRRLSWLGHLGLMTDDRLPKKLLFCQV